MCLWTHESRNKKAWLQWNQLEKINWWSEDIWDHLELSKGKGLQQNVMEEFNFDLLVSSTFTHQSQWTIHLHRCYLVISTSLNAFRLEKNLLKKAGIARHEMTNLLVNIIVVFWNRSSICRWEASGWEQADLLNIATRVPSSSDHTISIILQSFIRATELPTSEPSRGRTPWGRVEGHCPCQTPSSRMQRLQPGSPDPGLRWSSSSKIAWTAGRTAGMLCTCNRRIKQWYRTNASPRCWEVLPHKTTGSKLLWAVPRTRCCTI